MSVINLLDEDDIVLKTTQITRTGMYMCMYVVIGQLMLFCSVKKKDHVTNIAVNFEMISIGKLYM